MSRLAQTDPDFSGPNMFGQIAELRLTTVVG